MDSITQELQIAIDDLIITRFPSAKELRDNAETVCVLLYDAVESFAVRTGIRTTRFADAYASASQVTIGTLNKPHLSGINKYERLTSHAALAWLKSRLKNNTHTVLGNPRSKYWLGHADRELMAAEYVTYSNAEVEAELDLMGREEVLRGLCVMFRDGADVGELEYLADRYGIDLSEVIGWHEVPVVCTPTPDGNAQMAFDF